MKKALKIFMYFVIVVAICVAGLLTYVKAALPDVGEPEQLSITPTPELLARGEYLANAVCVCVDCHSTRDWTLFSGPIKEGTLGKGGEEFNQKFGFPGNFYSRNITPAGVGTWTDGELMRAITCGVSKDGRALFPVMPHPNYGKMDKEDIFAIITYIRSLKPIENTVPESVPNFPMNFIVNTIPVKAEFSKRPSSEKLVEYGAYLFNAAACNECHTKQVQGKKVEGMELAGGFEFPLMTGGVVRSANITPDPKTGIGNWTEDAFIRRFKAYTDSSYTPGKVEPGNFNSVMPWMMYGKMTEGDLKALYQYLRTVKPIVNEVEKFTR